MKNKYFKLFSCCVLVKGKQRSLICDLQRSQYIFISNDIFLILLESQKKDIGSIFTFFDKQVSDKIQAFFDNLIEREIGFYTNMPQNFPNINLKWENPSEITNAIVDYKDKTAFLEIYGQLEQLRCKAIQIRFYNKVSKKEILEILKVTKKSSLESIELFLPYNNLWGNDDYAKIVEYNNRITLILLHSATSNTVSLKETYSIVETIEKINHEMHCGKIDEKLFSLNTMSFTESQHYNTCLNRKISIDSQGNIKNCPSMAQSFGNIQDTSLEEALAHPDFKKYWNVKKDDIQVCRDCEFRHICTDCRAYIENPEDMYSKPLKCGYNPYTAEWEEWSTHPMKQKAIDYYGMRELVTT
jgi:SPASM domain peptide maturase of grasp-with-spasm system